MGKWIASIAGAIIAGLLIWWATRPGGIFNPQRATIKILSVVGAPNPAGTRRSIAAMFSNRRAVLVSVVNEGSAAAARYTATWQGLEALPGLGGRAGSAEFGLTPGEARTVAVDGYRNSGTPGTTSIRVECADAVSENYPFPVF